MTASGPDAAIGIGQPDWTTWMCASSTLTSDRQLCRPSGVAAATSGLWVSDMGNARALFHTLPGDPLAADATADKVLGQADYTGQTCNRGTWVPGPSTLCTDLFAFSFGGLSHWQGGSLAVDRVDNLWLADVSNSRVLRYEANVASGGAASHVLGQYGMTVGAPNGASGQSLNAPVAIALDTSVSPPRLWVAEYLNHRVLGWRDASTAGTGTAADVVIGQPDFTSAVCTQGTATDHTLCLPIALAADGAGNLWVAEPMYGRVMRFDSPFTLDATADLVLGHVDFTATDNCGSESYALCMPSGLAIGPSGTLYVATADSVRLFDPTVTTGMDPTAIFSSATGTPLNGPWGLALAPDGTLYVSEQGQNRVLVYDAGADQKPADAIADRVLGQPDLVAGDCHRGLTPGPDTMCTPFGLALTGDGTLFVSDSYNRVLEFRDVASKPSGAPADDVLGQADFASTDMNRGLDTPSADSLAWVIGIAASSGGSLLAADLMNNRALIFSANAPPTIDPVPPQTVAVGTAASISLATHDANGDKVTLEVVGAPASLTLFQDGTGSGTLAGTPTAADVGVHTVEVRAHDDGVPRASATPVQLQLTVTGGDGGTGANGGGGCCSTTGNRGGRTGWPAVLLALLLLVRRRRRH